ncbi:hypothetical protein MY1884_002060 [Beauveria asiatica]
MRKLQLPSPRQLVQLIPPLQQHVHLCRVRVVSQLPDSAAVILNVPAKLCEELWQHRAGFGQGPIRVFFAMHPVVPFRHATTTGKPSHRNSGPLSWRQIGPQQKVAQQVSLRQRRHVLRRQLSQQYLVQTELVPRIVRQHESVLCE